MTLQDYFKAYQHQHEQSTRLKDGFYTLNNRSQLMNKSLTDKPEVLKIPPKRDIICQQRARIIGIQRISQKFIKQIEPVQRAQLPKR
jgi:hypothetical protein